jgi:hypothetical protein
VVRINPNLEENISGGFSSAISSFFLRYGCNTSFSYGRGFFGLLSW